VDFYFKTIKKDKKSLARRGVIHTPHGDIQTPAFSPVATKASVKTLTPEEIKACGSQIVLGNTYHLYFQPGTEIIEKFGGFAPFMKWDGPTITDSGGYQVSFMWSNDQKVRGVSTIPPDGWKERKKRTRTCNVKITDYGAYFRSHLDGSKHLFTPEKSMEIQSILGADITMAFDQPVGSDYSKERFNDACERTLKWEERGFIHWKKLQEVRKSEQSGNYQALFGIIHGGKEDPKMRRRFLRFILETGFPGIAIGDESIGYDPKITAKALAEISGKIPNDKPLHALGLGGGPEGIFAAVSHGTDIFDNSSVTRLARTGLLFIHPEDGGTCRNKFRIDFNKSVYRADKNPLSRACGCFTCRNFSRAYIRHLFNAGEFLGLKLATIHNVFFINSLMAQIRESLEKGNFSDLKRHWLGCAI
jgi:queuine tRNA-ribosyltransferase